MTLRKHQRETDQAITDITAGAPVDTILARVTPGGGKSMLPIIAGRLVTAGLADAICWIVPRKSLQSQAESNFQDPRFREMLGHRLSIRASTNDPDPCRGLNGFATTYQAVGLDDAKTLERDFHRKRYIIVLDEFHHAMESGIWHGALDPLVNQAAFRLFMTGTLERGDGNRVAWTRYRKAGCGYTPAPESCSNVRVINYTRSDALAEGAILPLHFFFNDGALVWLDSGFEVRYDSMLAVPKKETSKAIYTALATDYANQLIDKGFSHWQVYRRVNPRAQMLIVTAGLKWAKNALEYVRQRWGRAEIATSHESASAHAAIKRFKNGSTNVLVSIAMAHEGLDVPSASHIICLTHVRSTPWIEQMVARAVRVDPLAGPYESQRGYVFGPDDVKFREIVAKIQAEQAPFLKKPKKQASLFENKEPNGDPPQETDMFSRLGIVPISANITNGRETVLGNGHARETVASPAPLTPSEIEGTLRQQIDSYVGKYAYDNRYPVKRINAEIKLYFGKSRSEMTITELRDCLAHVRRVYPIGDNRMEIARTEGISGPRGRGRRPPREAVRWYGS